MSDYLLTGFNGVRFEILAPEGSGVYPDWEPEHFEQVFHIPMSHINVIQDMGGGLTTITLRLGLTSMEDFRAIVAQQRQIGTLTMLANFTSAVGDRKYHEKGDDYEDLDNVELVHIRNAAIEPDHQWIECDATFRRGVDPITGRAS